MERGNIVHTAQTWVLAPILNATLENGLATISLFHTRIGVAF